jgi:pantoate--beta-alanine ligase
VQTVRTSEELTAALRDLRADGSLALVPTMGALHAGHLALVAEAKRRADRVAATIFVNPAQFNDKADLARYPRREVEDAQLLEEAGCDLLWAPSVEDVYPTGFATTIHVAGLAARWEGEHRPGHFDGVATVVARLLLSVRPDVALFGEKDFQQLAVIRRMVADLAIPVEIAPVPTVRDADGLALSSRNALLGPAERTAAPALHRALATAAAAISAGGAPAAALEDAVATLAGAGFDPIDYVACVDGDTLEPLEAFRPGGRLIAAAFLGQVRLIDNILVQDG